MEPLLIAKDLCNKDGICVSECPSKILRMNRDSGFPEPVPGFEEICIRCGHCVAVCPTGAFSLSWLSPTECPPVNPALEITPEQAEQFLRSRRSIRVFKEAPLDRPTLERLVGIACCAPSAKNIQPWNWVLVEKKADVDRLDEILVDWMRAVMAGNPKVAEMLRFPRIVSLWEKGEMRILRNAPHLLVVHVDRTWPFGVEDAALALGYLELFAPVLGFGATWSGYFTSAYNAYPPLAEALPVPPGQKVVGAMMLGRPKWKYHRLPKRTPPKIAWR